MEGGGACMMGDMLKTGFGVSVMISVEYNNGV